MAWCPDVRIPDLLEMNIPPNGSAARVLIGLVGVPDATVGKLIVFRCVAYIFIRLTKIEGTNSKTLHIGITCISPMGLAA